MAHERLIRLQRNRYVAAADASDLWPESHHRLEIAAAVAEMRGGPGVVSYESAAVLWDLPLYRHRPSAVHLSMPGDARMSSRLRARRHADRLTEADIDDVHGVTCTSLERTIWDVARSLPPETAIAAVDAALRQIAMRPGCGAGDAEEARHRVLDRCASAKGVRGVRQAARVVAFADHRAELPGESVSRFRLRQLGFEWVDLQVRVPGPDGREFRVDLELEDAGVFVEFDGAAKYRDEAMRSGRSLDDVLLAEKQREDWIRGVTGKRLVRLASEHVSSPAALRARLSAFGIPIPR